MAKGLVGGGLSRRRLNKLSCAGWLPHDRGFVSGLPRSKGRASAGGRLLTGDEDSPTGPAARQALRNARVSVCCDLLRLRAWLPDRWSWLDDPGDRPDEAHHLTRDRGGHDYLRLARRGQAAVALAQA